MGFARYMAIISAFSLLVLLSMLIGSRGFGWGFREGGLFIAVMANVAMLFIAFLVAVPLALEIAGIYILIAKRGILKEAFKNLRRPGGRRAQWWLMLISLLLTLAVISFMSSGRKGFGKNATSLLQQNNTGISNLTPVGGINLNLSGMSRAALPIDLRVYAVVALALAIILSLLIIGSVAREERVISAEEARKEMAEIIEEAIRDIELGMDPRSIIAKCYFDMCSILAMVARRPEPYETPREFEEAIISKYPDLPEEPIRLLTAIFEEAVYSNHALSKDAVDKALNALRELKDALRLSLGVGFDER